MNQRFIAPSFIVSTLCALGLCVVYVAGGQVQLEGALLFGAFVGMGVGMILWAKHLFPEEEVIQERHHTESSPEEQEEFANLIETGAQDVTRRRFLSRLAATALGSIGLAALFPLRSLGPASNEDLWHTQWEPGMRLLTEDGRPVKPSDLSVGGVITVWPADREHAEESSTLLIKVPQDRFKPRPGRENWAPQGNVAYSKICTHVGCPVGLYRETTHELLCPCHQSTFDVLDGGRPVFGPAARSLPQLPLAIDAEGYLIAQSDYREPIGPGFWNRGRRKES